METEIICLFLEGSIWNRDALAMQQNEKIQNYFVSVAEAKKKKIRGKNETTQHTQPDV